jgi:integrase
MILVEVIQLDPKVLPIGNGTSGNPCDSSLVQSIKAAILRRDRKFTVKNRLLPLSLKQLGLVLKAIYEDESLSKMERKKYDAMFALAFYCWFRFNEVVNLRKENLSIFEIILEDDTLTWCYKIELKDRKTFKEGDCGVTYELHDSVHEVDLYVRTKMEEWISCYPYFDSLPQNVYLFPKTSTSFKIVRGVVNRFGAVNPVVPQQTSAINGVLDKYARQAGILTDETFGKFTTHCFRRGGAQHRFSRTL